jgi:uncharacterized membrane protein
MPRTPALAAAVLLAPAAFGQGSFTVMPLVPFAPTNTTAAVSADGNFVGGQVDGPFPYYQFQAYRYAIVGGYSFAGDMPGGLNESLGGSLSPDGVWVLGVSNDGGASRKPFRWSVGTGMQALPLLPGGIGGSAAASSLDGSIVVGQVRYDGQVGQAVRWTPTGVQAITDVTNISTATDVSSDGQVVTGTHRAAGDRAFRWSPAGGLEILPFPAGVAIMNGGVISNDGSVIMGRATLTGTANDHYFRWTAATGSVLIMDLPGRARSLTNMFDMNADGSVAVGTSLAFGTVPTTAVIWDAQHGVRDLNTVAAQLGIGLQGYHLETATGISDDGMVIAGDARQPNFSARGYILRLSPYSTGACCMSDGTCVGDLTPPACASAGGTSWTPNVSCGAANCPPPGACCMPDGTCSLLQPTPCAAAGGTFAGAGVACAQANCPPGGACCNPDGSCSTRTASACAANSGVFRGPGTTCGSGTCPTAYAYSGAQVQIPDGSGDATCGAQAIAAIVVNDSFRVVSADASFFVNHTFQGDLRFTLRHLPTGTAVRMVDRPGYPQTHFGFFQDNYGQNFVSPLLPFRCSDAGPQVYDAARDVDGRYNVWGTWKSENPLAAFAGENSAGTWQLIAEDCGGGDTGTIVRWTLNLGRPPTCTADFNGDGDIGTDADIDAFFACLTGNCCPTCGSPDFNGDGDTGTDADIEAFFRVLAGNPC